MIFIHKESGELFVINWENIFGGHIIAGNNHGFVSKEVLVKIKEHSTFIGFI